ncbi:SMI1/KNR4 family protein [Aureivirga sp. CE67]|uniref:SMI1/KNR4 family protein n=1 Tax=Aureivirga sp. CE67 TaxID=1788983 RepID=UPI0018C9A141|nr:SMI1/KNR4 family protein [Aureivirga sp. CE67]
MEFISVKPTITSDDVEKFEKEVLTKYMKDLKNPRFPESFRKHVVEIHGGTPKKDILINTGKRLHYYYTLVRISSHLRSCYDLYPKKNYVGFVSDGGGNPFCFDLTPGKNYGKIYFCPMDGGSDYEEVAKDYDEFLSLLVSDEEY